MKNSHAEPRQKGFSLIELMISFVILAMSLLSISGLISFGHRGTQKDFRSVEGLQLLEERMNQLLSVAYKKIDTDIMAGATKQTVSSTIFTGEPCEIKLGTETIGKTDFTVTAILKKFPVSFSLARLDIDKDYEYNKVETYKFDAVKTSKYDGSDKEHPYRVIKVTMEVSWKEPMGGTTKQLKVMSLIVDVEA